ncbi:MAG: class I SAM-dependent methyltransferase [Planctomycetes bacterium]|nr:class I SAM-dependent methyltransferase [Planctomycetota bacterium]
MLRISQVNTPDEAGTATVDSPRPAAAAGGQGPAPTFATKPTPAPQDAENGLGSNHAAAILPWVTEEFRFHSVLDIACADGEAVRMLQEADYEAHGIDLAPDCNLPNIKTGDVFSMNYEENYFDLVLCCNFLHEIAPARVPQILAEIDRISNSYVMITMPSSEKGQQMVQPVAWWCDRIQDLGWRFRLLREDPETGQVAMFCERPNSLASQVLPLLDAQNEAAAATNNPPSPSTINESIAVVDQALRAFDGDDAAEGFRHITSLADSLLGCGQNLQTIHPIFSRIVTAMETGATTELIALLRHELRPALEQI